MWYSPSPPRPSSGFDQVLAGINTALKLADFYQSWKMNSQKQQTQELENIASQVKLARLLNPDTPVDLNQTGLGERIEKTGIPVQRQTEEGIAEALGGFIKNRLSGPEAPGAILVEQPEMMLRTGETIPASTGQGTLVSSIPQREAMGKAFAELLGKPGQFKPLMPQQEYLGVLGREGLKTIAKPRGMEQVMTDPTMKDWSQGTWVRDEKGQLQTWVPGRVEPRPRAEKTLERLEQEAAARARGKETVIGDRPTGELRVYKDTLKEIGVAPEGQDGKYSEKQLAWARDFYTKNKKDPQQAITQQAHKAAVTRLKNNFVFNDPDTPSETKLKMIMEEMDIDIKALGGGRRGKQASTT
jgi:hypothetical protein